VTTLETPPYIDDIVLRVFSRGSTYLGIAWNTPARPNGKIRKYALYMNGKKVYEGKLYINWLFIL
jgi:hypothetical protein